MGGGRHVLIGKIITPNKGKRVVRGRWQKKVGGGGKMSGYKEKREKPREERSVEMFRQKVSC